MEIWRFKSREKLQGLRCVCLSNDTSKIFYFFRAPKPSNKSKAEKSEKSHRYERFYWKFGNLLVLCNGWPHFLNWTVRTLLLQGLSFFPLLFGHLANTLGNPPFLLVLRKIVWKTVSNSFLFVLKLFISVNLLLNNNNLLQIRRLRKQKQSHHLRSQRQ